ncbi:hypothetical protein BgiMline_033823 [Biomphalaria glabrata]|nr:hypothetical protein BgiMline_024884 [Biomphalaria glabrata]
MLTYLTVAVLYLSVGVLLDSDSTTATDEASTENMFTDYFTDYVTDKVTSNVEVNVTDDVTKAGTDKITGGVTREAKDTFKGNVTEDVNENVTDAVHENVTTAFDTDNSKTSDVNLNATQSDQNVTQASLDSSLDLNGTTPQSKVNATGTTQLADSKAANVTVGAIDVNQPNNGAPNLSSARFEQVDVTKYCIQMEWAGMDFLSNKIQVNVTNNKTQKVLQFNVSASDWKFRVCDLDEEQSYLVKLADPLWPPGEVIETIMWTLQATPPYPPLPRVDYTTEKSIALTIFPVDFDQNTGPFSGFDIRISKLIDSENQERRYRYGDFLLGTPRGYSVTVLPTNTEQQFIIGDTNDGSNYKLTKDTEYVVYVGTVSTVAHISTHAYVSILATTCIINIHVIVMFLCFVVGIILLAYTISFIVWKRKKNEEHFKMAKQDELLLYLQDSAPKEVGNAHGDGESLPHTDDPIQLSSLILKRHLNRARLSIKD